VNAPLSDHVSSRVRPARAAAPRLSVADWRAFDRLQDGLPIDAEPFAAVAEDLQLSTGELLELIRGWLDDGILTRFGPLFDAEKLGGAVRLCAMTVPGDDFERIAGIVNAHPEVAHNYERLHTLNMWFVLASDTPGRLDEVTAEIEAETGLAVLGLPKLKEFFIGLKVTPPASTGLPETPLPDRIVTASDTPAALDEADRRLVTALQAGLPLVRRPYDLVAGETGIAPAEILARLAAMLERGAIRRIGAVPNHFALGWTQNAMTVWDVEESAIDEIGARIGHLPFVSHCYRRPRRLPDWPYSLFAMVHGRSREEVDEKMAAITRICGPRLRAADRLYSARILKKTGLRISG
jgi:DNA-binding Lrp family transcriptional regulator